ncbi:hypothetical protein [Candidatus Methanomassiliicoccus intestinalis]|uniref:hypothetical protein n=1 Tax=Candidatus Methanomassiliicoccus intestinalis TaxID=1406512 RepID=UPI0037DDAB9A
MKSEFNVLWFEDDSWYDSARKYLDSSISKHKLIPKVERNTGCDFDISAIGDKEYDLIIMDYMLDDGKFGDKIASDIRENKILTDILFYSSDFDKMKNALYNNNDPIEGIYYTKRDLQSGSFRLKLDQLVDKIVKRSENLVNLRGYVMDASCDFEERVIKLIKESSVVLTGDQKKTLNAKAVKISKEICRDASKFHNEFKNYDGDDELFIRVLDNRLFTHAHRLRLLQHIIKHLSDVPNFKYDEYANFYQDYENEVSRYRNTFGHIAEIDDKELHTRMRDILIKFDTKLSYLENFFGNLIEQSKPIIGNDLDETTETKRMLI